MLPSRLLLTGAAGFIGSNLAAALLRRGAAVVGLDDLSHGSEANLSGILGDPRFSFVRGDARDLALVERSAAGCGAIVHLAARKIPRYGGALETLTVNADGGRAVLEAARRTGARLYLASTSDVYGKNPDVPFREESALVIGSPKVARWSYAVSKMFEEQMFFACREAHGLKGAVFRFFGAYGPNQHLSWWGGPQAVFIAAALKGDPIEIHGDGLQTRSFCFVSDTVAGILGVIESERSDGEVINLGSDEEVTIRDLAERIWRLAGAAGEPRMNFVPYSKFGRYEDVRRRVPDLSLARELLGFQAQVPLDEGLARTIAWQRGKA